MVYLPLLILISTGAEKSMASIWHYVSSDPWMSAIRAIKLRGQFPLVFQLYKWHLPLDYTKDWFQDGWLYFYLIVGEFEDIHPQLLLTSIKVSPGRILIINLRFKCSCSGAIFMTPLDI